MRPFMARPLCAFILLLSITLGGCTSQTGGRLFESDSWRDRGGSLGKVAIILTGRQELDADAKAYADKNAARFHQALKEALAQLPATTPLDDAEPARIAPTLSEHDALAAAKARGAQSVCLVTVADAGANFMIGIFPPLLPGWATHSYLMYSLRVLDVDTGTLLLECVTYRSDGGEYQFCNAEDAFRVLKHDLRPPVPATTH